MSCLVRLKDDIRFLEFTFSKRHPMFQIISASVDEISCRFVTEGAKYVITANITVSFPIIDNVFFHVFFLPDTGYKLVF